MPTRRFVIASAFAPALSGLSTASATTTSKSKTHSPAAVSHGPATTGGGNFQLFLNDVAVEARTAGVRPATLAQAFAGVMPNQKVLDRDRHQPEFTMTWAQYRTLVITDKRIADGRKAVGDNRELFLEIERRFGVGAGPIAGIWGLESGFGAGTGDFRVVEALATLAWEGRRARFFRGELIAALKILDHGDVAPGAMTGSYAGAMGQPQFMPSSYLRYAVDFEGNGRRDIWTSKPDVLASIANYLAKSGWQSGSGWGQPVTLPPSMTVLGRDMRQPVSAWARDGVRPLSGRWAGSQETTAALLAPDGRGGEAYLAFSNFDSIRRYNPSDYYAIAVGLIGDQVTA